MCGQVRFQLHNSHVFQLQRTAHNLFRTCRIFGRAVRFKTQHVEQKTGHQLLNFVENAISYWHLQKTGGLQMHWHIALKGYMSNSICT